MSKNTILEWMMGLIVLGMAAAAFHNLIDNVNELMRQKKIKKRRKDAN
ncbi:hypothetical protein [Xylocopilactobacillus apicola]|uniref:Uncharacterized protein n=1 Tax=Xylocopilactobacillus apicola TaxID=2932184 RepID=A0AAU9DSC5_9LACO|nr:hypothetical protein [Xylocopilactobacillus apicola]BDR58924.1 hypothetical protein XA3_13650 [Xylocopilactobacillus apicola]